MFDNGPANDVAAIPARKPLRKFCGLTITGLPQSDATAGYKCFRREVLETLDLDSVRSNGYAFQIELSYRAHVAGFTVREVSIVFTDRTQGQSKITYGIVAEAVWRCWALRWHAKLGHYNGERRRQ